MRGVPKPLTKRTSYARPAKYSFRSFNRSFPFLELTLTLSRRPKFGFDAVRSMKFWLPLSQFLSSSSSLKNVSSDNSYYIHSRFRTPQTKDHSKQFFITQVRCQQPSIFKPVKRENPYLYIHLRALFVLPAPDPELLLLPSRDPLELLAVNLDDVLCNGQRYPT